MRLKQAVDTLTLHIESGLKMLAQVRSVRGSAQGTHRSHLRIVDAVLAGADVRDLATVEAIAAGTWTPGGESK